jgi:hypothetical protein
MRGPGNAWGGHDIPSRAARTAFDYRAAVGVSSAVRLV